MTFTSRTQIRQSMYMCCLSNTHRNKLLGYPVLLPRYCAIAPFLVYETQPRSNCFCANAEYFIFSLKIVFYCTVIIVFPYGMRPLDHNELRTDSAESFSIGKKEKETYIWNAKQTIMNTLIVYVSSRSNTVRWFTI